MIDKIYYPALFFSDIVDYYGGSPYFIEEKINSNIAKIKRNKLFELKQLVSDNLHVKKTGQDSKPGEGLCNKLKETKTLSKDQKKIEFIGSAIDMVKSMDEIDQKILEDIMVQIQVLSEQEPCKKNGYSDSSITRFEDPYSSQLGERHYIDIIKYLIEPETENENDYLTFRKRLEDCFKSHKYGRIPKDKLEEIQSYLQQTEFKSRYILRIFRILEQCSVGFLKNDKKGKATNLEKQVENDKNIIDKLKGVLKNIWGEIDAEGVGISQNEKENIILMVCNDLLIDYKFYTANYKGNIELEKGFQALVFYRLYNQIFYYKNIMKLYGKEVPEDIGNSLAFFAFSILQRAIEHTQIMLHPASRIKVPVYIGDGVIVGKQCRVGEKCILHNNVCLYPFNMYNKDCESRDLYIDIGSETVLCESVKIVGSIQIGRNCIIDTTVLVGSSVNDSLYITDNKMLQLTFEEYTCKKNSILNNMK